MERIFTVRERRIIKKHMTDKITEQDIKEDVAREANKKHGVTPEGSHMLSGDFGTDMLTLAEENRKLQIKNTELLGAAMVDPLTGLANERALNDMVQGLESKWKRDGIWGTFVVADLSGLHDVNHDYGRSAGGDDYLRLVGTSLKLASRPEDRVFRMGTAADEFILYLSDVNDPKVVHNVLDRADDYLKTFESEAQAKYKGIRFSLSYSASDFGARYAGGSQISPLTALTEASNNMSEAKNSDSGERVGNVGRIFADHKQKPVAVPVPVKVPEHV